MATHRLTGDDEERVTRLSDRHGARSETDLVRYALRRLDEETIEQEHRVELLRERCLRLLDASGAFEVSWRAARGAAEARIGDEVYVDAVPHWVWRQNFEGDASPVYRLVQPEGSPGLRLADPLIVRPAQSRIDELTQHQDRERERSEAQVLIRGLRERFGSGAELTVELDDEDNLTARIDGQPADVALRTAPAVLDTGEPVAGYALVYLGDLPRPLGLLPMRTGAKLEMALGELSTDLLPRSVVRRPNG